MPLQATSGAASYDGFGGGVAAVPNYIEDVFSTYLYTPTTSNTALNIPNGIDLSTKGGMVWFKKRSGGTQNHSLVDTVRGGTNLLTPNDTFAAYTASIISSFNTDGFTTGTSSFVSIADQNFASWTFRKQPKFFDVVTYTGDGVAGRQIPHNLGSVPGCIILKSTSEAGVNWNVFHRSIAPTGTLRLNLTDAQTTNFIEYYFGNDTAYVAPTSTVFTVGGSSAGNQVNGSGATYVAYLFAHNAGGFGLTGTDNVISCGELTTDSNGFASVNLGYEPQFVIQRLVDFADDWYILDTMRDSPQPYQVGVNNQKQLKANTSAAESNTNGRFNPNATGFTVHGMGDTRKRIYIAIRRGPMKVPTSGTSVFAPIATTPTAGSSFTTNFPFDASLLGYRAGDDGGNWTFIDRLRGYANASTDTQPVLRTSSTGAEFGAGTIVYSTNNTGGLWGTGYAGLSDIFYFLRRAPSFFDEVCYTGTGSGQVINHNLGVTPELMIFKARNNLNNSGYEYWYTNAPNTTYALALNSNVGESYTKISSANSTTISLGSSNNYVLTGQTYVVYLFATCAGVSKVGSYTGNGSSQTINCGFTGGARFVLIKRTDSTGDWYVYDTARGMTTLTDPYLLLNSTAAESATLGSVTTVSTGFALNAGILAAINTNGASYIFLAIS